MDYAICLLSVVPVRYNASDPSEIVTQLLFGNSLRVLEYHEKGNWCKIQITADGYEGWVDPKQIHVVSEEVYEQYQKLPFRFALGNNNVAKVNGGEFSVLQGSELRLNSYDSCVLDGLSYQFKGSQRKPEDVGLIRLALSYLGAPYLWGGKNAFGIDCSGFVQQVFLMSGEKMPRDASQQVDEGEEIAFSDVREGDLAYFVNEKESVIHVGICLEGNRIIHAHGQVRIDKLNEEGIVNLDRDVYSHKLSVIKRVLFE